MISVLARDLDRLDLEYDLSTTTDGDGRFSIPFVPPGPRQLSHRIVSDYGNGTTSSTTGQLVDVTVKPGETTSTTLGGGYRVVGRLRLPPDFTTEARWVASLHTPFPEPPAEIRTNQAALQRWYQSPEIESLRLRLKQVPVSLSPGGTFAAETVSAGNYILTVMLHGQSKTRGEGSTQIKLVLSATHQVTVPSEPAVGEIDLGEIPIQKQPLLPQH